MDAETEFKIDGLELRDADWAAQSLGIERNTVYKFLNDGTLPGFKLGKKWFVDATDVATFVRQERIRQTNLRRIEHWVNEQLSRQAANRRRADESLHGVSMLLQQITDRGKFSEWILSDLIAVFRREGIAIGAHDFDLDSALFDLESALRGTAAWVGLCVHCSLAPVLYSNDEDKSDTAGLCRECRDEYLRIIYEDSDPERDPFVRRGIA